MRSPSRHISSLAICAGDDGTDARLCGVDSAFAPAACTARGAVEVAELGGGVTGDVEGVVDDDADAVCAGIVVVGVGDDAGTATVLKRYGARVERLRPNIPRGEAGAGAGAGAGAAPGAGAEVRLEPAR